MKQLIGIVLFTTILLSLASCYNTSIPKPDKLISKNKFVEIMTDIYLVQGLDMSQESDTTLKKISQTDLYFSVLDKYKIPDTVFIRSLIYYSSLPKEYEKIHNEIMGRLQEAEQQFKPKDKLDATENDASTTN